MDWSEYAEDALADFLHDEEVISWKQKDTLSALMLGVNEYDVICASSKLTGYIVIKPRDLSWPESDTQCRSVTIRW